MFEVSKKKVESNKRHGKKLAIKGFREEIGNKLHHHGLIELASKIRVFTDNLGVRKEAPVVLTQHIVCARISEMNGCSIISMKLATVDSRRARSASASSEPGLSTTRGVLRVRNRVTADA